MKVRFFCVEVHGGGTWKRFDFTVQAGGMDPQGNAVLYVTDPGDFLAFEPGKMYETDFHEVRDEQSEIRPEPETPGSASGNEVAPSEPVIPDDAPPIEEEGDPLQ